MQPRFKHAEDGSRDEGSGERPAEREATINSTVHLDCYVFSTPPADITWYKNGEEIRADKGGRVRVLEGGTELVVVVGGDEDSARYSCVARNVAGEVEKHYDLQVLGAFISHHLFVLALPKIYEIHNII